MIEEIRTLFNLLAEAQPKEAEERFKEEFNAILEKYAKQIEGLQKGIFWE